MSAGPTAPCAWRRSASCAILVRNTAHIIGNARRDILRPALQSDAFQLRPCNRTRTARAPCRGRCTRPRARATSRPLARADAALDVEPAARDRAAGQSGRRALCCRCPLSLSAEASNGTPAIGFGCIGKITTRAGIVRIADDLRMIWGCYCPHDDLRMLLSAYCLHPL